MSFFKNMLGSLFSSKAGSLTDEVFIPVLAMRTLIARERMRCDRTKSTFSLLTLTLATTPSDKELVTIGRALRERLRETDDLGLMGQGRLGVILPDTAAEGAWKVASNLRDGVFAKDRQPKLQVYVYSGDRSDLESEATPDEIETEKMYVAQAMEVLFMKPLPAWKRGLDVVGALVGLTIAAPVMLVAAVAIKVTSPGPVFFTQRRDTINGRPFKIYKFRTMCVDAESKKAELRAQSEQDGPAFKMAKDPRVTSLGRLLRKTSIDELPQLFNVLLGDMSLVGPRPLPCEESNRCEAWQRRRLDVTPGLTCIWQVRGRSKVSFSEWARMDVEYIRSRSLLSDLKLILKTIPAVLFRRGAC
jgi:lipopolysaccharide/colanic/teichoic acid biosynthesis glycosyltransferase